MKSHGYLLLFFLSTSLLFGFSSDDVRESDILFAALYHSETFHGENALLQNPPDVAKQKLLDLIAKDPNNADLYKILSEKEIELLDVPQAELHIRQYVEKSQNKDQAYRDLEAFYHGRLRFEDELKAMMDHAQILKPQNNDVLTNSGRYLVLHQMITQISQYGLPQDPKSYYEAAITAYPDQQQPYLEYINYLHSLQSTGEQIPTSSKKSTSPNQAAMQILEKFKTQFPNETLTYLKTKASLLTPEQAFELLNQNYDPLWDVEAIRMIDSNAIAAGKKSDYLNSLKTRLQKNSVDFDAATRLFYAYHLAGNLIEAQNALNDFRLLKDQKGDWSARELYVMAKLSQLIQNYNESARYYYALFTNLQNHGDARAATPGPTITRDDALFGLYEILLSAEDRPLQLSAGNLDLYKDIATADSNPGVLNGLLSLILNSDDPASRMD
ncbi:MAG: hypothetical protein C5B54_01375, partial [Acidobacteria bacterium]